MPIRKPGLLNRLLVIFALAQAGGSLRFSTIQKTTNLELHTLARVLHSLRSDTILEKGQGNKGQWHLKPGWVEYGVVLLEKLVHKKCNTSTGNKAIEKEIALHSVDFGLPWQPTFEQVKDISNGAHLQKIKTFCKQHPDLLRISNYSSIRELNSRLKLIEKSGTPRNQVWQDFYKTSPDRETLENDKNA